MEISDQQDYDKLKQTLLRAYMMTEVGYRDKFRETKPLDDENFTQFVTRLAGYMDRWIDLSKTEKTFEALRDLLVRDQVLSMCNKGLRGFIQERKPTDLKELAALGVTYLDANGRSQVQWAAGSRDKERQAKGPPGKKTHSDQSSSHSNGSKGKPDYKQQQDKPRTERQCWLCQSTKHIAKDCTKKTGKPSSSNQATTLQCKSLQPLYVVPESKLHIYLQMMKVTVTRLRRTKSRTVRFSSHEP